MSKKRNRDNCTLNTTSHNIIEEKNFIELNINKLLMMDKIILQFEKFMNGEEIEKINYCLDIESVKNTIIEYIYKYNEKGYLYCLYDEVFQHYGENVYKLGCAKNLLQRMSGYSTTYIVKSEFMLQTDQLINYEEAEKILFILMNKYRIKKSREFFNCKISKIQKYFEIIMCMFKTKTISQIVKEYDVLKQQDKNNINLFLSKLYPKIKLMPPQIDATFRMKEFGINSSCKKIINVFEDNNKYKALLLYKSLINNDFAKHIEKYKVNLPGLYFDHYKLKLLDDLHKI